MNVAGHVFKPLTTEHPVILVCMQREQPGGIKKKLLIRIRQHIKDVVKQEGATGSEAAQA